MTRTNLFIVFSFIVMSFSSVGKADPLIKGLKPGQVIPVEINLPGQNGVPRSFEDLKGRKGLIILFNRSSEWCGFCIRQMVAWNDRQRVFKDLGYNITAITYDDVAQQRRFADEHDISYPVLSDRQSRVISAFGLLNEKYGPESKFYGIPHPAIYILAKDGTITHRFANQGYKDRPEIESVLKALDSKKPENEKPENEKPETDL